MSWIDRRHLGRTLTVLTDASVEDVLRVRGHVAPGGAQTNRIGITGPPGAGKSTLVALLARHRLGNVGTIGVLAVDPTSPVSGGSVLGDRVRIDALLSDERLFVRSVPSRADQQGVTDNLSDLLAAFEAEGPAEIIVETVGVGQANYGIRELVDTVVVIVPPGAGDGVQAMKAGILEIGDIYVVTKADLPSAEPLAEELAATISHAPGGSWQPRVLLTSKADDRGVAALSSAIDEHRRHLAATIDPVARQRARARNDIERLIVREIREAMNGLPAATWDLPLEGSHALVHAALTKKR